MNPLIILAVLLSLSPAALAASPAQADWRRDGVDERVKAALTGKGWRLEDDGRALDPKTKAPAGKEALEKAVRDLRLDAQRAALETVNVMLASGKPLSSEDLSRIETLSSELPPSLLTALQNPKSDMNAVKRMAEADLSRVADYFDGGRTMAERRSAAQPVSAGTPGPRVDLPYFTSVERSIGEKLQASAHAAIGRDPFGKKVLARLPALPPIVIEDQNADVAAHYDYRRKAVVLDREMVLASVVGTVPPRQASALRASLPTRAALMAYLDAHPEAVSAVVKDHDVVLVHELTHAWQDRRDPIFREMARGNIPDTQPLEYEDEAYKTQNLYLHSKIRNDPASVAMNEDFKEYVSMIHGPGSWQKDRFEAINRSSPSRALPLQSIREIQKARAASAAGRTASTAEQQQAKALDLLAMNRGAKELATLEREHEGRMKAIDAEISAINADRSRLLGPFYLGKALTAANAIERSVLLDQAERYAKASKNATLLAEIRKAKEPK